MLIPSSMSESQATADRVMEAMKEAMRAKDTAALTVLRGLKSAFKYAAIEQHGADGELDEAEAVAVVRKQIKQRQDSIESFRNAGRGDLADKEAAEMAVLEAFLPAALTAGEVEALVTAAVDEVGATSRKEMGAVMKLLQERAAGRVDNKVLSAEVMKRLS